VQIQQDGGHAESIRPNGAGLAVESLMMISLLSMADPCYAASRVDPARPLSTDGVRYSLQVFGMVPFPCSWVKDAMALPELSARWMVTHDRHSDSLVWRATRRKTASAESRSAPRSSAALGDVSIGGGDGQALGGKRVA